MEFQNLGRSGLKVSRLCLGMMNYGDPAWRPWILPEQDARPIIKRALDLGINFFDTADMYSDGVSESLTGRVLLDYARREELVIATKVFMPTGSGPNERGLSRVHIMHAVENSLKRLGTDYIDLYQIHRYDCSTPIEETLEALTRLVKAGKVRYLGASSMNAWRFARYLYTADRYGWSRFVSMQNYYNLIYREEEREMIPFCREEGVGVIPFSPLARGFLAGNRGEDGQGRTTRAKHDTRADELLDCEADFAVLRAVNSVAEKSGLGPAQVSLAWLYSRPGVTAPVMGSTRVAHLEQAVAALGAHLEDDWMAELEAAYTPRPQLDFTNQHTQN